MSASPSTATRQSVPKEEVKSQTIEDWVNQSQRVIWPTNWYIEAWERCTAIGLFYTFLMTPVQVAFLQKTPIIIFVLNRIVDLMLVLDMVLIMFVATTEEKKSRKKVWVTNIWIIRQRYLKSLFLIDVGSLLSSITELLEYGGIDFGSGDLVKFTRFARLIRLVRIVRMVRLAVVMNILRKKVEDLMGSKEAGFISVEILKWCVQFFLMAHVLGCAYGFTAMILEQTSDNGMSWIKLMENNKGFSLDRDNDIGWLYVLSLYWAFETMTTVGYGDVSPATLTEVIVVCVLMLCGGCAFTLLMANVCSVTAGLDEERMKNGMDRDALVGLCNDRGLDDDLKKRLRDFLAKNQRFKKMEGQQQILSQMSPALQGQVAVHTSSKFFEKVTFLKKPDRALPHEKDLHHLLTRRLAESLSLHAISIDEWLVSPDLVPHITTTTDRAHGQASPYATPRVTPHGSEDFEYESEQELLVEQRALKGHLAESYIAPLTYLESGVAVLDRVRLVGHSWHEDMVLRSAILRRRQVAKAVTFCSIYILTPESLDDVLSDGVYDFQVRHMQKFAALLALTRLLQKAAEKAAETGDWDLVNAVNEVGMEEAHEKEVEATDPVLSPIIETSLHLYNQQVADKGTLLHDAALLEILEGMQRLKDRQALLEKKLGLS